ncbi:MAG: hypothetical protein ACYC69_10385 [Thermodesulfovibrionales bacterium]
MIEGYLLKMFGQMYYLVLAVCVFYGIRGFVRQYRTITCIAKKTGMTVSRLEELLEIRYSTLNKA